MTSYCLCAILLKCLFTLFFVSNSFARQKNLVPTKPTGKFLLFTDFHIDNHYDQRGDTTNLCHWNETIGTNQTPKSDSPGPFGSRNCDPPLALIEFIVKEAQKQVPNPDYIIWTGDNAAHDAYDEPRFFNTLDSANLAILRHFPDAIVIPVVGNHESVPGNDFADNGTNNFAGIFDRWKQWVGDGARETFLRGGYYLFRSPLDDSTFVILNTNFYYVANKEIDNFEHPDDPAGQFAFLERQLGETKRNNGTLHILAHIPIGAYEMYKIEREGWRPEMARRYNQRLYEIFVEYAPWIGWMLFGHLHTDTFRIIKAPDGTPVQRMFLNPAVTPLFNLNNPAFRVFEYNPQNMDIEDIKTFFVELEALNKNQTNEAKFEYSFREAYRIQSMALNAETMDNLLRQMRENETVFDQYFNYSSVQWMSRKLNETERAAHLCVMEYVDFDQLEKCVNGKNNAIIAHHFVPHFSLLLLLFLGSLLVFAFALFGAFLLLRYIRKKNINKI